MKFNDDAGSAILEFVTLGVAIQVPLLVFALQISQTQANQFAAEAAARHSMRAFQLNQVPVQKTVSAVLADFSIGTVPKIDVTCNPDCDSSGAIMTIRVGLGSAVATSVGVLN